MGKKFLSPPRHALDIHSHRAVVKAVNALKNGKITDAKGNVIGIIHYADGNTVFEITAGDDDTWPPTELDPTQALGAGNWRYVSTGNPLFTTGLKDLVTGMVLTANRGLWRTLKPIPAQTSDTPPKYNVPQWPPPGTSGAVSGSPLQGDLDGTGALWFYFGDIQC